MTKKNSKKRSKNAEKTIEKTSLSLSANESVKDVKESTINAIRSIRNGITNNTVRDIVDGIRTIKNNSDELAETEEVFETAKPPHATPLTEAETEALMKSIEEEDRIEAAKRAYIDNPPPVGDFGDFNDEPLSSSDEEIPLKAEALEPLERELEVTEVISDSEPHVHSPKLLEPELLDKTTPIEVEEPNYFVVPVEEIDSDKAIDGIKNTNNFEELLKHSEDQLAEEFVFSNAEATPHSNEELHDPELSPLEQFVPPTTSLFKGYKPQFFVNNKNTEELLRAHEEAGNLESVKELLNKTHVVARDFNSLDTPAKEEDAELAKQDHFKALMQAEEEKLVQDGSIEKNVINFLNRNDQERLIQNDLNEHPLWEKIEEITHNIKTLETTIEYFGLEVNHELLEGLYISSVKKAVRKRKALRSSLSHSIKDPIVKQSTSHNTVFKDLQTMSNKTVEEIFKDF